MVDGLENVLVKRFGDGDELAILAVEFPQQAILAGGEHEFVRADIHQHTLEAGFHVQCFAGHVLKVPLQLAGARVERQCRVGVKGSVRRRHATAGCHPGFRLGSTEVVQVQLRVITTGNPVVAAAAQFDGLTRPTGVIGVTRKCDGGGAPQFFAGARVVTGDKAAGFLVAFAAVDAADHDAAGDEWPCRVCVALMIICLHGTPQQFAGARLQRHDGGVVGGQKHLVLINRDIARGAAERA